MSCHMLGIDFLSVSFLCFQSELCLFLPLLVKIGLIIACATGLFAHSIGFCGPTQLYFFKIFNKILLSAAQPTARTCTSLCVYIRALFFKSMTFDRARRQLYWLPTSGKSQYFGEGSFRYFGSKPFESHVSC